MTSAPQNVVVVQSPEHENEAEGTTNQQQQQQPQQWTPPKKVPPPPPIRGLKLSTPTPRVMIPQVQSARLAREVHMAVPANSPVNQTPLVDRHNYLDELNRACERRSSVSSTMSLNRLSWTRHHRNQSPTELEGLYNCDLPSPKPKILLPNFSISSYEESRKLSLRE